MTTERKISLTGFDELSKFEIADVEKVLFRHYDKLAAQVPFELKIIAKTYNEKGSRAKHSMTFDGYGQDGAHFKATSDAWDLLEALQEGLEKIEWQVRKHAETR